MGFRSYNILPFNVSMVFRFGANLEALYDVNPRAADEPMNAGCSIVSAQTRTLQASITCSHSALGLEPVPHPAKPIHHQEPRR